MPQNGTVREPHSCILKFPLWFFQTTSTFSELLRPLMFTAHFAQDGTTMLKTIINPD